MQNASAGGSPTAATYSVALAGAMRCSFALTSRCCLSIFRIFAVEVRMLMHGRRGRRSGILCALHVVVLSLPDESVEAGSFQALEHLLSVVPVGKGTDLDAVELIGGRRFRLGGLGLLRRLERHA